MALPQPHHLNQDQISQLFVALDSSDQLHVVRILYKNHKEIRISETMTAGELRELLIQSQANGHLPGGDLEISLPMPGQILVGHHDGVFWLQPSA